MTDSSTGGYLLPEGSAPLYGQPLLRFLQQWVVGISGLAGAVVIPSYGPEPPNIPTDGTCWCNVAVTGYDPDPWTYFGHDPDADGGLGADIQNRHEKIDLLLSFYDTGYTGLADAIMAQTRDGMQVSQNNEVLMLQGFGFNGTGKPVPLPTLTKEKWLYRVDLPVRLSRQILRQYDIRNVETAEVEIQTQANNEDPLIQNISVDIS